MPERSRLRELLSSGRHGLSVLLVQGEVSVHL